ncbi:hypothetical protein CTAYLR_000212 [Chrysophaeum taylorii]|uniref:Enhancer of polycomb-like protein n=1 Tax=Chrysophaeum taylorii TaxID=2483200 RepID=A0AAD7UFW4_9STRA|nr:hypothetical protein CTAYLR_000212 [Chrysophaeum taylorii]
MSQGSATSATASAAHRRREVRARPIDVYKRLPIARLATVDDGAAKNDDDVDGQEVFYDFVEDEATKNVVRCSLRDLEAGAVCSTKSSKRLNIPTPVYREVTEYESYAQRTGIAHGPFVRGDRPPRALSLARHVTRDTASGALAAGAAALASPKAASTDFDVAKHDKDVCAMDEEIEYVLGTDDEKWLAGEFRAEVLKVVATTPHWTDKGGYAPSNNNGADVLPTKKDSTVSTRRNGAAEKKSAVDEARTAACVDAFGGDALEALVDALELATGSESPVPASKAVEMLQRSEPPCRGGVGASAVSASIAAACGPVAHAYWLAKRRKIGKPLLRRFWPKTAATDTNPHCVFRPREKERYKLRKHRKNDVDAFRKLQQLRRDFENVRELCGLVARRERIKRLKLDADRGALRRSLALLAEEANIPLLLDGDADDHRRRRRQDEEDGVSDAKAKPATTRDVDNNNNNDASKALLPNNNNNNTTVEKTIDNDDGEPLQPLLVFADAPEDYVVPVLAEDKILLTAAPRCRADSCVSDAPATAPAPAPADASAEENGNDTNDRPKKRQRRLASKPATTTTDGPSSLHPREDDRPSPTSVRFSAAVASALRERLAASAMVKAQPVVTCPESPEGPGAEVESTLVLPVTGKEAAVSQRKRHRKKSRKYDADVDGDGATKSSGDQSKKAQPPTSTRPCVPSRGFMDTGWWVRDLYDAALVPPGSTAMGVLAVSFQAFRDDEGTARRITQCRRRARFARGGRIVFDRYELHRIPLHTAKTTAQQQQQQQQHDAAAAPAALVAVSNNNNVRNHLPQQSASQHLPQHHQASSSSLLEFQQQQQQQQQRQRLLQASSSRDASTLSAANGLVAYAAQACVVSVENGTIDNDHDLATSWRRPSLDELETYRRDHNLENYYPEDDDDDDLPSEDTDDDDNENGDDKSAALPVDEFDPFEGPPRPAPTPLWRRVADDSVAGRFAAHPPPRFRLMPLSRLAEIAALSDSEDEELQPLDAPEQQQQQQLSAHQPPRVKFAVDV